MIHKIEHASYMSTEQRQQVLALLVSLPVGCRLTTDELLPCGHFAFTLEGPGPVLHEIRKQLTEIVGFDPPGLRAYTLQEAYNTFGWRTYTNIQYKGGRLLSFNDQYGFSLKSTTNNCIIYGMMISSGEIRVQIQETMESEECIYATLDDLASDWEWPDGKPCGIVMPSKSVQRREDATGHKYRIGFD